MVKDLNKLTTSELGQLFPVIITDYNPAWKKLYSQEKHKIMKAFGSSEIRLIEHIGSTAVPGLCAKPTIDILIEISYNLNLEILIKKLQKIQYQFIPKPDNPPPHAMFAKGYSENGITGQTYHVHIRFAGDWNEITFRDFLIMNPDTAQQYGEIKRRLSIEHKYDREKYTDSKTDFIKHILTLAGNK